ncbi:hypothetical protein LXL04_019641 [Taraxacum kok-saghyz]
MAYADLQMFMEKLKQLIYCNDNPIISNPSVLCERPQFLHLYEELGSLMHTPFIKEGDNLEKFENVRNQRKILKAVAEEAEDIVDLFLSTVYFNNKGYFPRSDVFHPSLHLEGVVRSIKSIKTELMTLSIDNMSMDSSRTTNRLQIQSPVRASSSRNSLGSKKLLEELVVGLDRDVEIIRDKLVEDRKQLEVVSIVGMGGIGKTTLATKVFSDPYVVHHFYVRAWVTVSQTFEKRDLLIQILSSIGVQEEFENANEFRLRQLLHKSLTRKRYLIVVDDIWSMAAWDKMKLFFPDDGTGSRVLLTSRLVQVASDVKSDGLIHQLKYLTVKESWELLCRKVFQNDECPNWLIEPGMRIAINCKGLPLALVIIAGVLAKEARDKDVWERFAISVRSYITSDQRGCLDTLALSYDHLPLHLRECFLYVGGYSEDSLIDVERLIWLWMAEGFIQEDGTQSMEEIAEGYLMDLVDRNLVLVVGRDFNGKVGVCKLHDLVRELCMEKAKEERFFVRLEGPSKENMLSLSNIYVGCPKTILETYNRLPLFLKKCFHSLGCFRENSWRLVQRVISQWIGSGLVNEDGSMSLEEIAQIYLIELVDNNLVILAEMRDLFYTNPLITETKRKSDGDVKFCKVNDDAWNLCIQKANEENLKYLRSKKDRKFFNATPAQGNTWFNVHADKTSPARGITTHKPRRVFTNQDIYIVSSVHPPTPSIRSLLCSHSKTILFNNISEYIRSFALLRVLSLPCYILTDFPPGIALLVHLRYLQVRHSLFPSSICNLWSLQTLIVTTSYSSIVLPSNISNLVNLKHLRSNAELYLPSLRKPMNLQSISNVMLGDEIESFQKCFPIIKKLVCNFNSDVENDFELLRKLETLTLRGLRTVPKFLRGEPNYGKNHIKFPSTLKNLTLGGCFLPWRNMSIIQSLPNLEDLRLIDNAFKGTVWETGEEQFQKLKFLRLEKLDVKQWEASSINFPCLKRLLVFGCRYLEEIPLEIGDISTLEFLEAKGCGSSLNESLGKIKQEQEDVGNYELKIKIAKSLFFLNSPAQQRTPSRPPTPVAPPSSDFAFVQSFRF